MKFSIFMPIITLILLSSPSQAGQFIESENVHFLKKSTSLNNYESFINSNFYRVTMPILQEKLLEEIEKIPFGESEFISVMPIINCIETSAHDFFSSKRRGQFLPTCSHSNPMDLFFDLHAEIQSRKSGITASTHQRVWGILAAIYLKIAVRNFRYRPQTLDAIKFVEELKNRVTMQKTNYSWFVLWGMRLTALITAPHNRNDVIPFEAMFDSYHQNLSFKHNKNEPSWLSHKAYKHGCKTIGSLYTRKVLSPFALSKLFPYLTIVFFPFEMSDISIFETASDREGSYIWPLGFTLEATIADGQRMNPFQLANHDLSHLGFLVWILSGSSTVYCESSEKSSLTLEKNGMSSWKVERYFWQSSLALRK